MSTWIYPVTKTQAWAIFSLRRVPFLAVLGLLLMASANRLSAQTAAPALDSSSNAGTASSDTTSTPPSTTSDSSSGAPGDSSAPSSSNTSNNPSLPPPTPDQIPTRSNLPPPNSAAAVAPPPPTVVIANPAYFGPPIGTNGSTPNGVPYTQSLQLTTPALFSTGTRNLSQVATVNSLTQAFAPTSSPETFFGPGPISSEHGPLQQVRLGPLIGRVALSTNVVYDDNLRFGGFGSSQKFSDVSYAITPAVSLEYGDEPGQRGYALLTYAPTLLRYLHYSNNDSDNQNVNFMSHYTFDRLTLSASESYSQSSGVNNDTNTNTTETAIVSTIGASYDFTDRLSLVTNLQDSRTSYAQGGGQGDTSDSVNTSLNYRVSKDLTVGPSVNFGYEKPDSGGNGINGLGGNSSTASEFEQATLGVTYQVTAKINTSLSAGAEFRQFEDGGGDTSDPIFSLGVGYMPFDSTSVNLNAYRTSQSSSFDSSQTVNDTGVSISVTQRFIQRIFVNLSISYDHDEYEATRGGGSSAAPGYSQDAISYRPSISYHPTLWTSVDVYYQYQDNRTHGINNSFHDNQVGLSLSAQF